MCGAGQLFDDSDEEVEEGPVVGAEAAEEQPAGDAVEGGDGYDSDLTSDEGCEDAALSGPCLPAATGPLGAPSPRGYGGGLHCHGHTELPVLLTPPLTHPLHNLDTLLAGRATRTLHSATPAAPCPVASHILAVAMAAVLGGAAALGAAPAKGEAGQPSGPPRGPGHG